MRPKPYSTTSVPLTLAAALLADHLGQFFADELLGGAAVAFVLELDRQLPRSTEAAPSSSSLRHLQEREGVLHGQLGVVDR